MSPIFEYFVVCGIGPEIRSIDGNKGYHGTGCLYLPSLLDQYPPPTHSLYPPPPPQLPTVCTSTTTKISSHSCAFSTLDLWFWSVCVCCYVPELSSRCFQCVLPAGVEFYSSGFDSDDPSTFPRSYPIVLTGMLMLCASASVFSSIYLSCYLLFFLFLWKYLSKINIVHRSFLHRCLSDLGIW